MHVLLCLDGEQLVESRFPDLFNDRAGCGAVLIPAWRAATMDPMDTLRTRENRASGF